MIKFLDLRGQYSRIKSEIDAAIANVLHDAAFVGGPYVEGFERAFAEYQMAKHCVGVANGTDAVEICLEALALPAGSEVIVPANTFIATSEAVTRTRHRVVFCDCDPITYTMSVEDCERRITSRTSAIITVHLYGHPCDMDPILNLAYSHGLKVIEDCAQAHGCEYKGRRVGSLGDVGAFSFYPGKNLGAYGDAGAIITGNDELARKCRMLANHGRVEKYNHQMEGRNSRLDGLQAAILNVKLKHLDDWTNRRMQLAVAYRTHLEGVSLTLPSHKEWAKHVYHLFVIRSSRRDALQWYLKANGIETGIHYPIALPKLHAYAYLEQDCSSMFCMKADGELLSLPMGDHLSVEEIIEISAAIRKFQ